MKINLKNKAIALSDGLVLNTIVAVEELMNHDMIYIYHHLNVGAIVSLTAAGTNVKGDLRYRVTYKNFMLGFVTIKGPVKALFEGVDTLESTVVGMKKQKFLPIQGLDLSIQATKMRMVS